MYSKILILLLFIFFFIWGGGCFRTHLRKTYRRFIFRQFIYTTKKIFACITNKIDFTRQSDYTLNWHSNFSTKSQRFSFFQVVVPCERNSDMTF